MVDSHGICLSLIIEAWSGVRLEELDTDPSAESGEYTDGQGVSHSAFSFPAHPVFHKAVNPGGWPPLRSINIPFESYSPKTRFYQITE